MPTGTPRTFHKKYKFLVEIDGITSAAFQKCSALEAELAKSEYHEGGSLIPDKSAGRLTVSDVTLDRGVCFDVELWNWFKDVVNMTANTGAKMPDTKRGFDIVQMDRDGEELRRWTITGAWPTKFTAGDWDNESDDNVIETMVCTIDTFDLTLANG